MRYGLARKGRILLGDEMGVGKTVQALALAACYQVLFLLASMFVFLFACGGVGVSRLPRSR